MDLQLEKDLQKAVTMISSDWNIQSDDHDQTTNFIYRMDSLQECLKEIECRGVDRNYALHRWYNYKTSVQCENIFCEYGAVHEKNRHHHNIDIYIDDIPFDVKLTVYPSKLSHRPYDLKQRGGKDDMIRWYYANQSKEGRKQLSNRLYVVCDAGSSNENMFMKSNFGLMRQRISIFMDYVEKHGIRELVITDLGKEYRVKSDLILLNQ